MGYTGVENGQNQYYEQGLIHVHDAPTAKITLDLAVARNCAKSRMGRAASRLFSTSEPPTAAGDSTTINLSVTRRTDTSALFEGQDIEMTEFDASIRQRIFQKLYVTINGELSVMGMWTGAGSGG